MSLLVKLSWHAYRTPLIHPVKAVLRALSPRVVSKRKALVKELGSDPATKALADDLNANGFTTVTSVIDPAALASLQAAGDAKLSRVAEAEKGQSMTHKDYWVRMLDEDMIDGVLPTDNPFVRFALQPSVMRILGAAIGELPQLDYVLLTFSKPSDKPLARSQLWHRDFDDTRTIKLFVYLTDVDSIDQGPFTFIPGPQSDKIGFALRSHRPDDEIFQGGISPDSKVEMIAPKSSVFMVETSRCVHMGSRMAPGNHRLLYTATYTTLPHLYPIGKPAFRLTGKENRFEQCMVEFVAE